MDAKIIGECDDTMRQRLDGLDRELSRVRTGRASVSLLDSIKVDYYGNMTPLNQVASLSTPDPRTIVVSPFEKKMIGEIERAIHKADVGVQPNSDGNVIRLPIPALTEDRRKDIAKSIRKIGEETKVGIRKARQDFNGKIKKLEKDKEVSEDDSHRLQKDVQSKTDNYIKEIDDRVSKKEAEVLNM